MERRVIKFNLVGAICVLILIISIIIGIIVFAVKGHNKNDGTNDNNQIIEQDKNIDENKEYKEKVTIKGNEQEIIMKACKGTFGYSMKYDVNSFYVEKDASGRDEFNSLYSNTINVIVFKRNGNYDEKVEQLKLNSTNGNNKNIGDRYNVKEDFINGLRVVIETEDKSEGKTSTYYVRADDGYFVIEANCGYGFEDMVWPIIEKMIGTFKIL